MANFGATFSYAQDFLTQKGTEYITVEFYKKPDGKEMVKLHRVGDRTQCQHLPAGDRFHYVRSAGQNGRFVSAKEIWPDLYAAFLSGADQAMGLPLSVLGLDRETVYHYGLWGITTIQQLQSAGDDVLRQTGLRDGQTHRDAAAQYLANAEAADAGVDALARIDALERENQALKEQLSGEGQIVEKEGPFYGWTVADLRNYLSDNGVKLHGGWKVARLTEEAEKVADSLKAAA